MDNTDGKQVNWGFIFIITALFGFVAIAFLTLVAIGGFLWLDMKEDVRTTDAWREKYINSYKDQLQKKCESNLLKHKALIEVIKENKIQVPPEFLVVDECGTFQPQEQPKK